MKSVLTVIPIFLAGQWANAASQSGQGNGLLHVTANSIAGLVPIPSGMTDADGLLFLGVCLVVISWLLRKKLFGANN
ncbi:MAG TPA: hypothetical protein VFA71_10470 [Terriglobales bacterium]|nr:hypothetical protein [Terriglobales bacterium]